MGDTMHRTNVRPAFTLVELLVVIVIIGILMSLMTAAAMHVSRRAKTAAIKMDITQLVGGVEAYKNANKDYPPDVAFLKSTNTTLKNNCQDTIIRHIRQAFTRYSLPAFDPATVDDAAWQKFVRDVRAQYTVNVTTGPNPGLYVLDPDNFDPTTALVFFLGGLPEGASSENRWNPAGFHADPQNPFQQGSPRKESPFTFNVDRIRVIAVPSTSIDAFGDPNISTYTGYLRIVYMPPNLEASPYVYFRARKDTISSKDEFGRYIAGSPPPFTQFYCTVASGNICVPYRDGSVTGAPWRSEGGYQIIAAGLDDTFGEGAATAERRSRTGEGFSSGDFDNIANFSEGTLEDEIP